MSQPNDHKAALEALSAAVRLEREQPTPDLSAEITRQIRARQTPPSQTPVPPPPRRSVGWQLAAPVFVVAAIVGSVLAGFPNQGADTAFADLATDMVEAQSAATAFSAEIEIVEYGWADEVPTRTYRGGVSFEAPDELRFEVRDTTDYQNFGEWPANDVALSLRDANSWSVGRPSCPRDLRATCATSAVIAERTTNQSPFAGNGSALDLILPVGSLLTSDGAVDIHDDAMVERSASVVLITGSTPRFSSLLATIFGSGDWRPFAPIDEVQLELDPDTFLLRKLTITAGDDPSRLRWSLRTGFFDTPDSVLLTMNLTPSSAEIVDAAFEQQPPTSSMDAGFRTATVDALPPGHPVPEAVPTGLDPWRAGTIGDTTVTSWTDGRSWLTIESTTSWTADRLFGDFGPFVQTIGGANGTVYVSPDGQRVGVHTGATNIEVAGTLGPEALISIAESLKANGEAVVSAPLPDSWLQAPARSPIPADILRPQRFTASRLDGATVSILAAGPGRSGFQLIAEPGAIFGPPQNPDVEATTVRSMSGRYTPDRNSVEWIEDNVRYELVGVGLTKQQLITAAEELTS